MKGEERRRGEERKGRETGGTERNGKERERESKSKERPRCCERAARFEARWRKAACATPPLDLFHKLFHRRLAQILAGKTCVLKLLQSTKI